MQRLEDYSLIDYISTIVIEHFSCNAYRIGHFLAWVRGKVYYAGLGIETSLMKRMAIMILARIAFAYDL